MSTTPARGLPPRIYLPVVIAIAVIFLAVVGYFLRIGFGMSGSGLALREPQGDKGGAQGDKTVQQPQNVQVGGGPPPAVQRQLSGLKAQIAAHPSDDVALVQLGDLYLAVQKYRQAIPLYKRALAANPKNVAAKAGLDEATSGIAQEQH